MMEDTKSGIGVIGVLFVILVIWAIFGNGFNNGFGCGNRGNCSGFFPEGGCGRVSNCEVERSGIINTATTQFLVEQNGAATRTELHNTQDAIMAQASRIYEAQQAEKMFDLKLSSQAKDAKIAQLETQIHNDAKFAAIEKQVSDCCCGMNQRFSAIECNMLTKPSLSGVASTCNGQLIPAPWGNCGCNGNRNI